MTLKEAVIIFTGISQAYRFSVFDMTKEELRLDGIFTIQQLEALVTIFKHKDQIYLIAKDKE